MNGKVIFFFLSSILREIVCWQWIEAPLLTNGSENFTECTSDLAKIFLGLNRKEIWAMKIIDASTKFPSGVFTGHLLDYGNYDECLGDDQNNVTTQHCFADFKIPANDAFPMNVTLKLSYCIPASCSPDMLRDVLQEVLRPLNISVTVNGRECSRNGGNSASAEDYVGIVFWAMFLGLAVLSTIYDAFCRMRENLQTSSLLSSFSVYSNGKKLLNTSTSENALMPLHGLRFLSICWIILGHRCFLTIFSSLLNLTDLLKTLNEIQTQVIVEGILAVDTFFLLSGLLNSYNLLTVLDKTKKFPAITYYLHRYIRLTPVLAAMVSMYATWYVLIGDGPHWHQTTAQWKEFCIKNWWPTLLYINNYYNPTTQCMGQSWYLAVDMQLYWLSPLIIIPLWKKPKFGKIGLGVLLLGSIAVVFAISFFYKFRAPYSIGLEGFDEFLKTTRLLYVPTHTRATPYIIGIMLGYYLRFLKKNKIVLVLSKGILILGWLTTTAICLSVILGNFQFMRAIDEHPYDRIESSFYISLHRVGWGFGISWIIICCVNKMGGFVNDILSWKVFIPLSRLTYCIFLCHLAIQQYQLGTARTTDYFQYFNQFHRFLGDLFFSILFAIVITLVFESPILTLEKLVTRKLDVARLKGESNKSFEDDNAAVFGTKETSLAL